MLPGAFKLVSSQRFRVNYSLIVSRCVKYYVSRSLIDFKSFSSQSLQQNGNIILDDEVTNQSKVTIVSNLHKNTFQHGKHKHDQNKSENVISTEWVQVTNIPQLSTLDDLLPDIERIMNVELSMGIVDLDAAENMIKNHGSDGASKLSQQLPLWEPNSSLPPHLVVEARVMLSTLKRQQGWYLKFPNRSVVHALMSHLKEAKKIEARQTRDKWKVMQENKWRRKTSMSKDKVDDEEEEEEVVVEENIPTASENSLLQIRPLMCAWRIVEVSPFYVGRSSYSTSDGSFDSFMDGLKYMIGDNVLRVENCSRETTVDDLKYFFRRFALYDERQNTVDNLRSVELVVKGEETIQRHLDNVTPCKTNSFLVRFASSADARAALTEKQNVELLGKRIRLARYSRQMIDNC
jgi:hypothetical protein